MQYSNRISRIASDASKILPACEPFRYNTMKTTETGGVGG